MLFILLVLCVIIVALIILSAIGKSQEAGQTEDQIASWQRAVASENSTVGRILINAARPASRMPRLYDTLPTKQYRLLQSRLLASGAFGSDIDVFLAVQALCVFIGIAFWVAGGYVIVSHAAAGTLIAIVMILLGAVLMSYPYNIVSKKAKLKAIEISDALPEFAELLQMPLTSGMGVLPALAFTADRLTGPVADEVRNMQTVMRNNPNQEEQAFLMAGERLGTQEAKAFFGALLQAQVEGARVLSNLAAQAESLRVAAFQRQRSEVKKLPVKLVIMMGLHFMPLLFVAALLPVGYALTHFH